MNNDINFFFNIYKLKIQLVNIIKKHDIQIIINASMENYK